MRSVGLYICLRVLIYEYYFSYIKISKLKLVKRDRPNSNFTSKKYSTMHNMSISINNFLKNYSIC